MPAWGKSLVGSVMTIRRSMPTITSCEASSLNDNGIINGSSSSVNHPRLLTSLKTGLLKLSFLKRCCTLKRPPQSLRLPHPHAVPMRTFIQAASVAETEILKSELKSKQHYIDHLKKNISLSDRNMLEEENEREIRNLQKALDRKFSWLLKQDTNLWSEWPNKSGTLRTNKNPQTSQVQLPSKKSKNLAAKERRAANRIKKISQIALESCSVVNLSTKIIPPEAIAVLSKRIGFVPTAHHDKLKAKVDINEAMAKLCSQTVRNHNQLHQSLNKSAKEVEEFDDEDDDNDEEVIPDFLKLKPPRIALNCGDTIVDGVKDNLLAFVDILKPKSLKGNLNIKEKEGLNWVLKEVEKGEIQFVKADKGGALCIIDRSAMYELEAEKLNNPDTFECLGEEDPTQEMYLNLLDVWREGEKAGFVSRKVCYTVVGICDTGRPSTLSIFKPGTPYYYGLLKLHKCRKETLIPGSKIPLRLVNDLSQSPTSRSDKYINWKFLKPLQEEFCSDLVKDSTEALRWLEDFNGKAMDINGFAWDFASLYDNLTPELVMEALLVAITELRPDWSPEFLKWLFDLVDLNLKSSVGKFGKFWYRNKVGIVTGGSLSVSLANIAVFYALRCAMQESNQSPHLLGYRRFLDDIAGLWTGSKEEYITWADMVNGKLNEMGLSIKDNSSTEWDFHPPTSDCVFLDIRFRYDKEEGLLTDVHIKSTDARVYLHYSSYHPRQTFKSVVYSQCLRFRRLINDGVRFLRRLQELKECFVNSGYPKVMVEGIIKDVSARKRNLDYKEKDSKLPPNKVLWIQTYGPATNDIHKAAKEANTMLPQSAAWTGNDKVIGVVNRRPRNLADLILKRKKFALDQSRDSMGTTRCTPLPEPGLKRKVGRPCASCDLMSSSGTVKSSVNGKLFRTPSANCKSKNVIYCASCNFCLKQYVGKTNNKLQSRISGHRSHMGDSSFDESDDAALAEHLKLEHDLHTVELFNLGFNFTVLELGAFNLDECEQRWVSKLTTLKPFGLNKEVPRGVSDSVASMCRKSLGNLNQ